MPKEMKNKPDGEGRATLHREKKQIHDMLSDFSSNGVSALIIIEKHKKVVVAGNGFDGRALLPFLVDLFLRYPELYMACAEIIRDMLKEAREESAANATVH
jgi:hypothetical protein